MLPNCFTNNSKYCFCSSPVVWSFLYSTISATPHSSTSFTTLNVPTIALLSCRISQLFILSHLFPEIMLVNPIFKKNPIVLIEINSYRSLLRLHLDQLELISRIRHFFPPVWRFHHFVISWEFSGLSVFKKCKCNKLLQQVPQISKKILFIAHFEISSLTLSDCFRILKSWKSFLGQKQAYDAWNQLFASQDASQVCISQETSKYSNFQFLLVYIISE